MSQPVVIGRTQRPRTVYFDTNVFRFWDWHTKTTGFGSSNDPISDTIFSGVVISEYTIDELLTFDAVTPGLQNVLKKHILMLTILKDVPVLTPIVKCLNLHEANTVEPSFEPFRSKEVPAMGYVTQRLMDLVFGKNSPAIQKILDDKKLVAKKAQSQPYATPNTSPVAFADRISLDDWIEEYKRNNRLTDKATVREFYDLCQYLSEAKRQRVILPPTGMNSKAFYKPHDHFGEHIDFFHLSYVPLVTHFVTDDRAVREIVKALVRSGLVSCKIFDSKEYWSDWFRSRIV